MSIALHVDQQRDESCLGASEAGGVVGLDKYNPPIKIWRKHRGLPIGDDGDNEAAYWGTVLEPVIRGKYALDRKARVFVPTTSYTMDGWLRCTPDGLVEEPPINVMNVGTFAFERGRDGLTDAVDALHRDGRLGGLQVKTCSAWLADDWRDGPPAKYEVQCRIEMAVCDLPWNDIVCLCGGQRQIGPMRIERDMAIEDRLLESLREFWSMVQDGREPTVDHTDAWRLHVSEKMERARPVAVKPDEGMTAAIASWREQRVLKSRAEIAENLARNEILLRLSAAGATRIDLGDRAESVTAFKTKGTWTLRPPSAWKEDK